MEGAYKPTASSVLLGPGLWLSACMPVPTATIMKKTPAPIHHSQVRTMC
jgi:hypothetical protein